jgi:creatinine amidohydrolase
MPGGFSEMTRGQRPVGELGWLGLTWTAVETWITARARPAIVVPIGAVEQHGPFLPLGTDVIIADNIARSISRRLDVMVAPALAISASDTHLGFAGTLSVGKTMLREVLERLCLQLQGLDELGRKHGKAGFADVFLLSAHGGNASVLTDVSKLEGIQALPGWWELSEARAAIANAGIVDGAHADETETCLLLHYGCPVALPELPFLLPHEATDSDPDRPDTRAISASGIVAPGLYAPSAELGRELHEAVVRGYVTLLHGNGVPIIATNAGAGE